ncbi:MAG: hypothetical protein AAB787_02180 [Patescibacteria group bacterium]
MNAYEKIAKILRTDKDYIANIERRFMAITGKQSMMEAIVQQNTELIKDRLLRLGVSQEADAKEIYDALISKIESDDRQIFQALGSPNFKNVADCQRIGDLAKKVIKPPKGLFIKYDKAKEFLIKEPPRKVMEYLGYSSVEEMLSKEDLLEVYSALRFIEGSEWLNGVFFKQYESLTPEDFEEREVQVKALGEKWGAESEKFVAKKKHNISHLKELGVVFIIPALLGISGELLRMFVLVMHYLYEVPFYSKIFKEIKNEKITFTTNLTSLLRGDVIERHFPDSERSLWLVVQRYLAKDDENDWRLFVPHINPEAMHWLKAEDSLASIGSELDGFSKELTFWQELGWVGDYFKDETGHDILVSFNLVDTVMSLVKQKEMVKYLYHHQEAMWNQVFSVYFGREELEKKAVSYLLQGYFEV